MVTSGRLHPGWEGVVGSSKFQAPKTHMLKPYSNGGLEESS